MTKTILSALALAVAISFASCSNKKACNNKQDAAATQANDTANAASNNQEQADGSAKYTDFALPTLDGKRVLLSEVVAKNKITMVDFWASWCGPCRMEMPNVVKAYKDFHDKGLEMVGVSLDERKEDWAEAVKEMARLYKVEGIPACVLINQKGEIVGADLRAEELHARLAELLK